MTSVPIVIAVTGGIAFLVGLFGGGITVKEVSLPPLPGWVRLFASLTGIVLIGIAVWQSSPNTISPPNPTLATAVAATLTARPSPTLPPPSSTLTLTPTSTPTDTPVSPTDTPILPTEPPITPSLLYHCTNSGEGGEETIPVGQHIKGIRIDLQKRLVFDDGVQFGFSLWEVEINDPDKRNLARDPNVTASASSSQEGVEHCARCFPPLAIDGDVDTRWSSEFDEPQYLKIILPSSQLVDHIVLQWEAAYATHYCIIEVE